MGQLAQAGNRTVNGVCSVGMGTSSDLYSDWDREEYIQEISCDMFFT